MSLAFAEQRLNESVTLQMRPGAACLRIDQTVGAGLEAIRQCPPEGRIVYFYVVDEQNRLQGVVPTRRLLLSPQDARVADVMERRLVTIPQTATIQDACELFAMHRLLGFPVVDDQRRIVGVIDVDLYTRELGELEQAERSDDLFQLIGVHASAARPQASILYAFRQRFPWLLCNIACGIISALLLGLFKTELERVIALATFIPVVLNLAESVSTQSVSLALERLHGERPTVRLICSRLQSEILTGLLLGMASGGAIGLTALIWLGQFRVLLVLLGGIAGGVACSAVVGAAMPILVRLFRRDPRVAAGPIALASADVITLLVYCNLARWILV
jgi:magnesium transporter